MGTVEESGWCQGSAGSPAPQTGGHWGLLFSLLPETARVCAPHTAAPMALHNTMTALLTHAPWCVVRRALTRVGS